MFSGILECKLCLQSRRSLRSGFEPWLETYVQVLI